MFALTGSIVLLVAGLAAMARSVRCYQVAVLDLVVRGARKLRGLTAERYGRLALADAGYRLGELAVLAGCVWLACAGWAVLPLVVAAVWLLLRDRRHMLLPTFGQLRRARQAYRGLPVADVVK